MRPLTKARTLEVRVAAFLNTANAGLPLVACEDCGLLVHKTGPQKKLCSPCKRQRKRAQDRAYHRANAEKNCKRAKDWATANPDRVRERSKRKWLENLEENRRKSRQYGRDNAEACRIRATAYYWKNREKVLARMSSPEGRAYSRNRMREKMQSDPAFRLHSNISRAIRASIADKFRRGWEDIVGYSLDKLMAHLERQFMPGMNWNNHGRGKGKWNIDHIVPRASFRFTSAAEPDFRDCWALTNLRPLWSEMNISKHAKRTHLL